MITKAEEEISKLNNEIKSLQYQEKLKADVAYTHLTSIIKWLIATIIILFVGMIGSIIWFFNTFEFVTEDIDLNAGTGNANFIEGEANTINNGENNYKESNDKTKE